MTARILVLAFLAAGGCRTAIETSAPERLPTPIGEIYLPVYPSEVQHSVRLTVRALIESDGSVRSAIITPRSGSDLWDSLATLAIKQWRFSPALQQGRPVPAWVRFPVTLRFAAAQPVLLAEIVVGTKALADSIHALLIAGNDFGALAVRYSIVPSSVDSGRLGARPLQAFPLEIQMAITSVASGQVTRPVRIDGRYAIYKRLKRDADS